MGKKNITSKNITLQLQLHSVKGTLRANFPPAPSDRIWYGFREPPELDLALRPQFGGHGLGKYEGTISTVMKHLEKRLKVEFMKVLVCPNTDDLVLPFLHHVPHSLTEKNSKLTPESIYVPKIKASQSSHNFTSFFGLDFFKFSGPLCDIKITCNHSLTCLYLATNCNM